MLEIMKEKMNISREYIWTLKSELLDNVVKDYIDYINNPYNEHRQDDDYFTNLLMGDEPKPVKMPLKVDKYTGETLIDNLPHPQEKTARAKIQLIVDIIYRAYARSADGVPFHIKSQYFKEVTEQYKYVLDVLRHNFIIDIQRTYTKDNYYDRTYYSIRDPKQFHLIKVNSGHLKKEVERESKRYAKMREQRTKELIAATSPQFVERYNHNLRQLTINKDAACEYIRDNYDNYSHSALSRVYVVDKISQKHDMQLSKIDANGRFYHIGTQLQRDIKPFTNIKFSIDCKNSHPYLLTNVILNYIVRGEVIMEQEDMRQKDNSFLLYNLVRYLLDHNGNYIHIEFSDFIRKNLQQSKLKKQEIAKILELIEHFKSVQPDVWRYVYDAASGQVWDNFVKEFSEERIIVKQKIFESVIYSYTRRRNKKKETEDKWLMAFINRYPTVYDYIVKIKRDIHRQCKVCGRIREKKTPITCHINEYISIEITSKDEVLLPTVMMKLESAIFTEILRRLFNKRITCFGIHDAVAVIDAKKMSVEDIKTVMLGVYRLYGLLPTLSI